MSKTKPRGNTRLKLNLTPFQVEVLSVAAAEELAANHQGRDREAWQAIARVCQKALAYNEMRASRSEAPNVDGT